MGLESKKHRKLYRASRLLLATNLVLTVGVVTLFAESKAAPDNMIGSCIASAETLKEKENDIDNTLKEFSRNIITINDNIALEAITSEANLLIESKAIPAEANLLIESKINKIVDEAIHETISNDDYTYSDIIDNSEMLRDATIESKSDNFVTTKSLQSSDIVAIEPLYKDGKMVINSKEEAMCIDIREKSNWDENDFYSILNEEMYDLVPVAIRLEKEAGVNALYAISVGAAETGWGRYMAGKNNYFNWSNDGIKHFDFGTIQDFSDFSINTYTEGYVSPENYTNRLGFEVFHITPEVVNTKYAMNSDGAVNWQWSNVVCEIMNTLSKRRLEQNF